MKQFHDKKQQNKTQSGFNNLYEKPIQNKARVLQDNRPASILQRKSNKTGLPDNLKSGIENLSGHSMDDVKVHYNSDKPAQLNALAYAQGTDIHIASGQEKHLPHEAWHIVQQKQGRVKPTLQMKGKVNINDDKDLESEADVMGTKALVQKKEKTVSNNNTLPENEAPIQMIGGGRFLSAIGSGLYSGASYVASAAATGLSAGSSMLINSAKNHPYLAGGMALATAYAAPAIATGVALSTVAGAGINAYNHYKTKDILKEPKKGQKGLENLPDSEMWRMYINPKDHEKAINASKRDPRMMGEPGQYYRYYDETDNPKPDAQVSTHFGNSMLDAIHSELFFKGGNLGKKVDYKEYTRLHDLVTGRFEKGHVNERGKANNMRKPSSNNEMTAFPMNDWNNKKTKPAADLMNEDINGIPMIHDWKQGEKMDTMINHKVTYDSKDGFLRVLYDEKKGKQIAQQILDRYYKEINGVKSHERKIKIIVKAIRALHVAHPFKDANGRLHIQLMLNKFLLEQGFSPTILGGKGLGVFGGAFSIDELTAEVTQGMKTYKSFATKK